MILDDNQLDCKTKVAMIKQLRQVAANLDNRSLVEQFGYIRIAFQF